MGGGLKTPMKSTKINHPLIFMLVLYRTSEREQDRYGRRVHGRREESEVGCVCGQEGGGVGTGRGGRRRVLWVGEGVGSWSAVACVLQTTIPSSDKVLLLIMQVSE